MKNVHIDNIILNVKEKASDDSIREDYVRRILTQELSRVIPHLFFPVCSVIVDVVNGKFNVPSDSIKIAAASKEEKKDTSQLILFEENLYIPSGDIINDRDYVIDGNYINSCNGIYDFVFTEDPIEVDVASVYTEESKICLFYYSLYKDKKGKCIVPEFAERYLQSFGDMNVREIQLNKGLGGRKPINVAQTRFSLDSLNTKTTKEFLFMQRKMNLLLDRITIKPVTYMGVIDIDDETTELDN